MKRKLLFAALCALIGMSQVKAYTTTDLTNAGWTLVTSLTDNTSYVYVLVDAVTGNYIVSRDNSGINNRPVYKTLADPFLNPGSVWTIETRSDGYALCNAETQYYFQSGPSGEGWRTSMASMDDYLAQGSFTFTYGDNKYSLRGVTSAGYVGPWYDNVGTTGASSDGEGVAANKSYSTKIFSIYKMAKATYALKYMQNKPDLTAPVNLSFLVVNPTIYSATKATSAQNNSTGAIGSTGWIAYKANRGNKNYTTDDGNTNLEGWNGSGLNIDYYQLVANLPGGKYQATAYVHATHGTANVYICNQNSGTKAYSDAMGTEYADRSSGYVDIATGISASLGIETRTAISDGESWITADNFRMQGNPYVSTLATGVSHYASITSGLWYSISAPVTGDYYIKASAATTISYTQTGTDCIDASFSTLSFSAGETKKQSLSSGTLYFKANSDVTISIIPQNCTSLITNPDFSASTWSTGWTGTGDDKKAAFKNMSGNGSFTGTFAEMYVNSSETMSAGDINQTLNSLPVGIYALSAKMQADIACQLYASISDDVQSLEYQGGVATKSFFFSVPSVSNVKIGYKHNGITSAGANTWVAIDDFALTYKGVTLDDAAETFTNPSAVSVGTWYKFTTGNSNDAYILSSDGDATITYTTDGTVTDLTSITNTWTLHAKRNAVLAPNTTYYIKSSAAVTLTKSETSVTSGYVSGWTKVTSVSQLQTNPENYFFAIFSANNTDLMLKNRTTTNDEKPVYATAANPLSSAEYLFEMENYDSKFALKSVLSGKYFENRPTDNRRFEGDGPWNYHADLATKDANCKTTLSWVNNAFVIQTANDNGGNDYLGLWYDGSGNEGYKNNEILAGNKPETSKGSFIIYCIAKDALNMSSLITNPGFDACTAETSDVAAKTIKNYSSNGWTNANTGSYTTVAVTAYGGGKKVANSTTPSTKKDGSTVSGNALGIIAGWGDEVKIQSGDIILPAGGYTITVDHYLTSETSNFDSSTTSYVGFVTASNSYLVPSTTFPASTWTTETVTFTLTEPTTGKIQIGLKGNNKEGSGSPAVFYDDVTLTYYPFAEASDYTALATAITTADAKQLGFETGEYAPYNNVAALTALATAKAIDPSVANGKNVVQTATTALTGASWMANAADVDAIYNGNFALGDPDNSEIERYGWKRPSSWGQFRTDADATSTSNSTAYYNQSGSLQYGNAGFYTMPLKANTIYTLTFKYATYDNSNPNKTMSASVLNSSSQGMATVAYEANTKIYTTSGAFEQKTIKFVTTTAGNYVLTLASTGNTTITDVSITKASQTLTLPSATQYVAGTYPSVSLSRTFANTSNWYTLCAPFDFPKSAFAEVKVMDHVTDTAGDVNMTFTDASETIAAGTPCLVKPASTDATLSVENVAINPATSAGSIVESDGTTTVTYVGTFENTVINGSSVTNAWVVSNNALYHVAEGHNATVGAYRAYFTVATGGTVKALSYDFGDAVGIEEIDNGQLTIDNDKVIYNLAGQKMNKLQRGVNIVNGKKVLVK